MLSLARSANIRSKEKYRETEKTMPVTFQSISPSAEDVSFDPPSQPAARQAAIAIGIALLCFALVFGGFWAIARRRLARSATQTECLTSLNALTLKRSTHRKIFPISFPSPSLSHPAPASTPGYNASPQPL